MGLLVDSDVLIEMERTGRPLAQLAEMDERVVTSAMCVSELHFGLHRANSENRRRARIEFIEDVLRNLPVQDFDIAAAEIHGRIWAGLAASGNLIGAHDLIIAATALSLDHAVLTRNLRDFSRIPGLNVRRPDW